ncbi:hypothetical protein ABB37_07506 [Leptomonas pyrrhocoris]|uniref:Uncharacterized protein n=1 Tax=Leptomonas pyrrhocoris TaxID=157538 RepID=A0A0N0VDV1_LEPPY|nr:hypothetical protein ABB37_07506 [Leptomonas pyrrhocoris]KPA76652.1 hypothetical protein ABB37_07506 [Leptomonas pyrrhocoris]|eukprot:XP_015655091.1 hypothetical protein ABB37_07506 [Leptomonas pyrrhocoris]
MQPKLDGSTPSPHADIAAASQEPQQDVDIDPPSATSTHPTSPHEIPHATPSAAVAAPEVDDLEHQSKEFLLQRVRALERQLTIRNSDCARLLADRQQLLQAREKCASQRETILALQGQLDLARAQRESAVDAMETMKRRQRDQEHRDRIGNAERAMYGRPQSVAGAPPPPSNPPFSSPPATSSSGGSGSTGAKPSVATPNIGRRNPGGTVVNTAAGPQLLYDSSDISSVGFTKNARLPYDFLGGPGAQQQYLARYSGEGDVPDGGHNESEDAQVRRVINAAKDQADLEAKYAEMEDKEEEALMARIKALREGRK